MGNLTVLIMYMQQQIILDCSLFMLHIFNDRQDSPVSYVVKIENVPQSFCGIADVPHPDPGSQEHTFPLQVRGGLYEGRIEPVDRAIHQVAIFSSFLKLAR
jgi:hypothetical protein